MSAPNLTVTPIGYVSSPFVELAETPRQPRAAEGAEGTIVLRDDMVDAVADLPGWEYLWVIFWFHRAVGWKPKVLPPRSERKRGVLSTRAPRRPNPLGLSVVRLLRVEGTVLHVADLDLVDGTPVLDLKPYVPWTDAIPMAKTGWLEPPEGARPGGERPADPRPTWPVAVEALADAQLAWLAERGVPLRERLVAALKIGPQPHAYRRIKRDERGMRIAVKEWYARFEVRGEMIAVTAIESGMRPENVAAAPLHRAFGAAFSRSAP